MSSPVQEFADNLKLIRKGRNMTQTELAEKVGLTKQSIINYEKGLTFPTGKRLRNLLDALDVNTEQLLGRELSQSTSEKILLEECREKATFRAEYSLQCEQNSEDMLKKFLLNHLTRFDCDELYSAITGIYNQKIKSAHVRLTDEIADSITFPHDGGLNIDLWVKQDEDDED